MIDSNVSHLRHIIWTAFFSFSLLNPMTAFALWQIKSATESGTNYMSETLSVSQTLKNAKKGFRLNKWKLSLGQSKTTSTSDLTTTTMAGYLYPKSDRFDFTSGLKFVSTKETTYRSSTLILGASYEWDYGRPQSKKKVTESAPQAGGPDSANEEDDAFSPTLVFGLSANFGSIQQDLNQTGVRRRRNEVYSLGSNSAGLDLTWNALEFASVSVGYTSYFYSQSTDEIRSVVNNSTLLQRQVNLESTLYGLTKNSQYLALDFFWSDAWEASINIGQSTALIDEATTNSTEVTIGYMFESGFKLAGGTYSSGYTGQSQSTDYLLNLSYSF